VKVNQLLRTLKLIRIKPNSKNLDDLMDAAAYEKFLAEPH